MWHQTPGTLSFPRNLLSAAAGALVSLALCSGPADAGDIKIFEDVPPAEHMAKILLGSGTGGSGDSSGDSSSSGMRWKGIMAKPKVPGVIGFKVHFDVNSDRINPADLKFLDEIGDMMNLKQLRNLTVVVEGHTDARGETAYNESLSLRRARSVVSYLVDRHGIAPSQLIPAGRGERELLDRRDPWSGLNRRVEFYLPGAK